MALTNRQKARILQKKVRETLRNLRQGEKATVKEVIKSLTRAREEISSTLKSAVRFEMPYRRAIMADIDEKIALFTDRMTSSISDSQRVAFLQGENLVDDILKSAGVVYSVTPKLSDNLIVTAQEFSADLITNISDEMRKDINRTLRRGLLTGKTNFEVARDIDKIIGTSKRMGYMNRADVIARQEINSAFGTARQTKDEQVAEEIPELRKQWWTAQDERVRPDAIQIRYPRYARFNHREAHGQIQKVKEPFIVGGQKLMTPRDQSLGASAENVIGCRCNSIPWMEGWE